MLIRLTGENSELLLISSPVLRTQAVMLIHGFQNTEYGVLSAARLRELSTFAWTDAGIVVSLKSESTYDCRMEPVVQSRTHIVAWLLCAVLVLLTASAPHCDFCDGLHVVTLSSTTHPSIGHPAPVVPDTCNGICSCCEFHWIPEIRPVVSSIATAGTASPSDAPLPLSKAHIAHFRPPRILVSA